MAGMLDGMVALVTGASSGIGEATALTLAREGAKVGIAARRTDRLEDLARRIGETAGEALVIEADVTDDAQAHSMVEQVQARWGRLDIVVNNAGVMLLGPIVGADTEDWRRMVNINLLGLFYTTHAALPIMRAQGSGHIVNLSSVAGRIARMNSGVYNATKWGVVAFSESLRQEVSKRDHIRVTVVEPGVVETELTSHITSEEGRRASANNTNDLVPMQAQDIAEMILFAVTRPAHVNLNEMLIRPTEQER
jgi:NADP-dependent 3-hydroxy acid dehydrogenase YdfG